MNRFVHGPTETLRFADGSMAIVTKHWWKGFLAKQTNLLDKPSVKGSILPASQRGTGTYGRQVESVR
jgi:hypothetical protein